MRPDLIVTSPVVKDKLWTMRGGRIMSHPPDYPTEDLRKRAKDLLEYARTMKDPELRREVEIISESYERLADRLGPREDAQDDGEGPKPHAVKGSPKRVLFL